MKAVSTRENRLLSPLPFQFMERSLQFFRREISDRWSVDPVNGEVVGIETKCCLYCNVYICLLCRLYVTIWNGGLCQLEAH